MYLGINLSHGSSACLIDSQGKLISAIEEERISRVKNHYGIPKLSIEYLANEIGDKFEIEKVVHGSFSILDKDSFSRILANDGESPSNPLGSWKSPRPGWHLPPGEAHSVVEEQVNKILISSGRDLPKHVWIKHHDAHLGTALASSIRAQKANCLLVTLDGEGDGESGTVALVSEGNKYTRLSSTSNLDSLGYLYQAVTEKYNFKGNQHEGKITGLAAYGRNSAAVEVLAKFISVKNGQIEINYSRNRTIQKLNKILGQLSQNTQRANSIGEIIAFASDKSVKYEDLAFAIQKVLEDSVIEMLTFWLKKTGVKSLSVSGGVFANVKLNQRISETLDLDFFDVFPNMGDGGLSSGAVWSYLSKQNNFNAKKPYLDMFLASHTDRVDDFKVNKNLIFEELETPELAKRAAALISSGKFVGLHYSKMEFGPRALGHRSLLLDPRDRKILKSANERLRRTEFMPFAPVILASDFTTYFEGDVERRPGFRFMTITCNVIESKRRVIPAVTHVDGTARPQVVDFNANDLYSCILNEFNRITGVPVLVNTSLNVHETPINYNLSDSIKCLLDGSIDYIVTDRTLIYKTP